MVRYQYPKSGKFWVPSEDYSLKDGWEKVGEVEVIGEADDLYITRFYQSEIPYWDQFGKYMAISTAIVGIHKSRFIQWLDTQLTLFN